jgi:hypothetical protein
MTQEQVMAYYDKIMEYYDVIGIHGMKGKYSEKKGLRLLGKLDEWEAYFEELLDSGEMEIGA